ncbi:hypothetical protein SLEP1_g35900 [Rubroshorea leprosula]|uniref:Uncharacterized protein n=1 Tax=Rubroshorea leprosula TaxID=152421 RepID=A0AAV5KPT4_9ROSI|nr:hypothetical protein SLEP1_g35900 [Rubroshorea leprosula]
MGVFSILYKYSSSSFAKIFYIFLHLTHGRIRLRLSCIWSSITPLRLEHEGGLDPVGIDENGESMLLRRRNMLSSSETYCKRVVSYLYHLQFQLCYGCE